MKFLTQKRNLLKKTGAFLTATAVTVSAAAVFTNQPVSAESFEVSSLCTSLGVAHDYSVFARYFKNNSDMEGNMCAEYADIMAHDATNSDNNYNIYDNNSITVTFNGSENDSVTIALFEKSGDNFIPVPGTERTVTIPENSSSTTTTYYNSESLPLYQTNNYYLAKTNGSYEIIDVADITPVVINNNVSNDCYIANLNSLGGNFTRESFSDLVIYLNSTTISRTRPYNNGNGVVLVADDNTEVAYNTKLNLKTIGVDIPEINFENEFTKLTNLSKSLINASDSSSVKVISITADELYRNLNNNTLFNVEIEDGQYAVLNIDADSDTYNENNPLKLAYKINGVLEQWNLLASRVLVNIYDSTNGNVFTGKATCYQNGGTMGTILMPAGTYESGPGNTNGGVIAREIYLTAGEIHKIQFGFNERANAVINLLSDTAQTYTFSFIKTDSTTDYPLSGAGFTIYSDSECRNALKKITSAADGTVTFTGLSVGTYYIKETTVPDNYVANPRTYALQVESNGTLLLTENSVAVATDAYGTYIISNTPAALPYADFTVNKQTTSSAPLTGAGFTLYTDSDCKNALGAEHISDVNGDVVFTNLNTGVYYLKETTIPSGYKNTNAVYKVEVNAVTVPAVITVDGTDVSNGFIVKNSLIPNYNLTFKKTKADGVNPVQGASFTLYSDSACKNTVATSTSSADGSVTFTVAPGIYHLKETGVPAGYIANQTIYSATVSENGTITMEADITGTLDGTTNNYIIKNLTTEDITVDEPAEKIELIKRYDTTDLSTQEILDATVFTLYAGYDGATLSDPRASASPSWDAVRGKAVVSFENVYAPQVGTAIYYLKETASPVEYSTSDVVYECMIDSNANVTYRVYGTSSLFSEDFPICNNIRVYDPTIPSNPSDSDTDNGDSNDGEEGGSESAPSVPDDENDENANTPTGPSGGNNGSVNTPTGPSSGSRPSNPDNPDSNKDKDDDSDSEKDKDDDSDSDKDKDDDSDSDKNKDDDSDSDKDKDDDSDSEKDKDDDSDSEKDKDDDSDSEKDKDDDSNSDEDDKMDNDTDYFSSDVSGNITDNNPYTAVIVSTPLLALFLASTFMALVTKKRK